jgi:hypothetical protein
MPRHFRRYARSARTLKPVRYANETVSGRAAATIPAAQTVTSVVVVSTGAQGVRKFKNPILRLVTSTTTPLTPILWGLVYCPQGFPTASLTLTIGAAGGTPTLIFEPNQNVIMSGPLNLSGTAEPVTYRSRLARNLDSGDAIYLLFMNPSSQDIVLMTAFTSFSQCSGIR